jgi:hypothetical protein
VGSLTTYNGDCFVTGVLNNEFEIGRNKNGDVIMKRGGLPASGYLTRAANDIEDVLSWSSREGIVELRGASLPYARKFAAWRSAPGWGGLKLSPRVRISRRTREP